MKIIIIQWGVIVLLIVAMMCATVIWISGETYTFQIEMDNNTRDAIQSLNETIAQVEIPNTVRYNVSECKLITDIQEYWCIREKS